MGMHAGVSSCQGRDENSQTSDDHGISASSLCHQRNRRSDSSGVTVSLSDGFLSVSHVGDIKTMKKSKSGSDCESGGKSESPIPLMPLMLNAADDH